MDTFSEGSGPLVPHHLVSICGRSSPTSPCGLPAVQPWPRFCDGYEEEWMWSPRTDRHFPRSCNRRTCVRCTNLQMTLIADAVWFSRPEAFVTCTGLLDDWSRAHKV